MRTRPAMKSERHQKSQHLFCGLSRLVPERMQPRLVILQSDQSDVKRLSELFQELGRKSALACQEGSADDPWRGPSSAGSDSSSHLDEFQPGFPLPHCHVPCVRRLVGPPIMWSDLVPPKQSIGFMPHCRNTDGGHRELYKTSSSIEPPTPCHLYLPILCTFFFSPFTIP